MRERECVCEGVRVCVRTGWDAGSAQTLAPHVAPAHTPISDTCAHTTCTHTHTQWYTHARRDARGNVTHQARKDLHTCHRHTRYEGAKLKALCMCRYARLTTFGLTHTLCINSYCTSILVILLVDALQDSHLHTHTHTRTHTHTHTRSSLLWKEPIERELDSRHTPQKDEEEGRETEREKVWRKREGV